MWAFFTRRFRLWLLFALGVPLLRRVLGGVGESLEQRSGQTALTRGLRSGTRHLERYDRRAHREARRAPRGLFRR
ncbi:MAG: hypothetical protein GEU74_04470 [Nitriliruptorales bacterium]|nr:hypothetical protein [Nitriliruptorales bacterium]